MWPIPPYINRVVMYSTLNRSEEINKKILKKYIIPEFFQNFWLTHFRCRPQRVESI